MELKGTAAPVVNCGGWRGVGGGGGGGEAGFKTSAVVASLYGGWIHPPP